MPALHVYSRQGCHLCENLIEDLLPLVRGLVEVHVRDIDSREDWRQKYDTRVPVVTFAGRELFESNLDRDVLLATIASFRKSESRTE